jgi:hypothetical protein
MRNKNMTNKSTDPRYFHGAGEGWMEEQESDTPQQAEIEVNELNNESPLP